MKIFYILSNNYNQNKIVLNKDNSFCTSEDYYDFQVSLTYIRSFVLNFDLFLKRCVSCEGYFVFNKKTEYGDIEFNQFKNGELKIEYEDGEIDIPIYDYRINNKLKYDVKKNRLLLGDINIDEIIRFGDGQYASFKDNKLIGVIVDLTKGNFRTNSKNNKKEVLCVYL